MVRMTKLKTRLGHAITDGNGIAGLLSGPCPPPPPPRSIKHDPLPSGNAGPPWRRWEKGSSPKKTHHPTHPSRHHTPNHTKAQR
jgi:hypothetical protein